MIFSSSRQFAKDLSLMGIALVLAVLLNRNYPERGVVRTIFFGVYSFDDGCLCAVVDLSTDRY